MNNGKHLQFIASFLIVLILSIPFYTTSVYAPATTAGNSGGTGNLGNAGNIVEGINSISAKGSDGIEGFVKGTDFINFVVQVAIGNSVIAREQVKLGDSMLFDRCTPSASGGYTCTLRFPSNGTDSFEGAIPYTINFFKDDRTTIDDSKSGTIVVDNKPPQVRLSVSQNRFSSQDNLTINYDVTDFACNDPECNGRCVGLKGIEFYNRDRSFTQSFDIVDNDCNNRSSVSIETRNFRDGSNSIFAKATDNFNQVSQEKSVTFTLDTIAPNILSNSFDITRNGVGISTFSPNSVAVDVAVNISATDLNANSVTADLSALNPSQDLRSARASCTPVQSNLSICRWTINLNPGSAGTKTIVINASDTSGNKASITVNKQFTLDDKGPLVQSLSTLTTSGTQVLARPSGNTVTATFDEATGLIPDNVILHIGSSQAPAKSCTKQSSWLCTWENINLNNGDSISITTDTIDILRNPVRDAKTVQVVVDSTAPVLKILNISGVSGLTQAFPGFPKLGDKIAVVANLTEENDVIASADFSNFISGAAKVSGSCQKVQGNEHVCTWLTDPISLEASDAVIFNFSDSAGNTLIERKTFRTFGVENATVPDFWSNSVSCSPSAIDRSIGQLINERIYCQVRLTPKSTARQISTVFISPSTCSGGSSIVQNTDTFNTETGSASPIIKLTLKKNDFRINNVSLSCSFNIFSRVGTSTSITKNPEIETANINILFYNFPLGEFGDATQKKIDDAKKDALQLHKTIGALNKLVQISKRICQVFGIIYNIVVIHTIITTKIKTTCDAVSASPAGFVGPPICLAGTSSCFGQQAAETSIDSAWVTGGKFCKFVNCQWGPGIIGKWQEFITKEINRLPGSARLPGAGQGALPGTGANQPQAGGARTGLAGYIDPNNNLFAATLFLCLPGIIQGIDKFSQIKCLYADCLQNAVGKDGLPVTACEDQKAYATCKYIYGEVFAVVPYTVVFDHFTGLLKEALSNPFAAIGVGLGALCTFTCPHPPPASSALYTTCEVVKITSKAGEILQNIKGMINEGFKIRQDYCSRLDLSEKTATT